MTTPADTFRSPHRLRHDVGSGEGEGRHNADHPSRTASGSGTSTSRRLRERFGRYMRTRLTRGPARLHARRAAGGDARALLRHRRDDRASSRPPRASRSWRSATRSPSTRPRARWRPCAGALRELGLTCAAAGGGPAREQTRPRSGTTTGGHHRRSSRLAGAHARGLASPSYCRRRTPRRREPGPRTFNVGGQHQRQGLPLRHLAARELRHGWRGPGPLPGRPATPSAFSSPSRSTSNGTSRRATRSGSPRSR